MLKRFFSREKPHPVTTNSTMICCKLFHFPLREKVECIRYIFAFLSVPYQSVTINFDDWNTNDMASGLLQSQSVTVVIVTRSACNVNRVCQSRQIIRFYV